MKKRLASTTMLNSFQQQGYLRLDASSDLSDAELLGATHIKCLSQVLPPDPYDQTGCRRRYYGRMIHIPWIGMLEPVPADIDANGLATLVYQQPASLNPEENGKPRALPAFDAGIYHNPFLKRLIQEDLSLCDFGKEGLHLPIQIGVHLIRLEATPNRPAMVSPNLVHRDGEWYTAAHLIEFRDAVGAENWITAPEQAGKPIEQIPASAIRTGFTLTETHSGYIVRDDRVAHSVEAVRVAPGKKLGVRTILLIDFTPMKPVLMLNAA